MAFTASDWGQQAEYEINSGQVPSSQSSVPVLITMDTASFPSSMLDAGSTSALNGGGDIRASTDTAGANQIALEIVSCVTSATPANQELIMWVLAPTVADGETLYVSWNKAGESQPAVGAAFGRNAVWTSVIGKWGLNESAVDSSGNLSNGINNGYVISGGAGVVGTSYNYRLNDSRTDVPHNASLNPGGAFNFNFAFKTATTQSGKALICLDKASTSSYKILCYLTSSSSQLSLYLRTSLGVSALNYPKPSGNFADDTWRFVTMNFDRTRTAAELKIYLDGAEVASGAGDNADVSTTTQPLTFGDWGSSSGDYVGDLDEVEYSDAVESADLIESRYNNQSDQTAWATFGTPYVPVGSGIEITPTTVNVDYTATSTDVNTPQEVSVSSVNFDYDTLTTSVVVSGAVEVTASGNNVFYQELNPIVSVSAEIVVVPSSSNTEYNTPNVTISISTTIEVNPSSVNVQYNTYQAYVVNEDVTIECACAYEGVILDYISFNGIITGDISGIGIIDDTNIGLVGVIDGSDIGLESELCHCD